VRKALAKEKIIERRSNKDYSFAVYNIIDGSVSFMRDLKISKDTSNLIVAMTFEALLSHCQKKENLISYIQNNLL
jgi:hypothetical protein